MTLPISVEARPVRYKQAVLQDTLAGVRDVDFFARRIALHVETLVPRGRARCLDIGEGAATLAEAIRDHAPRSDWRCTTADDFAAEARKTDGRTLPTCEEQFDIALLRDALHRTVETGARVLAAAGRIAKRVLVKDHFETHCFTRETFTRLVTEQGFAITALDCGLSLDERAPVARTLLRPDCDFIAVLRRE